MRNTLVLCSVIGALAFACSQPMVAEQHDSRGSGDGADSLDPNNLMEDGDILGGGDVTAEQVQAFLDQKGSALASHTDESGVTAAQLIIDRSRTEGVNPVYILARIQGESSLIGSGGTNNIEKATGCGCPDGKGCAAEYAGFANQVTCAAKLIRKYFTQMDSDGTTTSGYAVGQELQTLDPCSVTPANRATTALYTYTPWVGSYGNGCGSSSSLGSSGIAHIYADYKQSFPTLSTTIQDPSSTPTDPATTDPVTTDPVTTTPTPLVTTPPVSGCVPLTGPAACAGAGVKCGPVVDGCGAVIDCGRVAGFGCSASETCFGSQCFAKATKVTTPTPPTTTPATPKTPPVSVGGTTSHAPANAGDSDVALPKQNDGSSKSKSDPSKKSSDPSSAKEEIPHHRGASACSATPGESSAPEGSLLALVGAVVFFRRRRRA